MSEGLDAIAGEAKVEPVVQPPVEEIPATEATGQSTEDSSAADGQPTAQAKTEDSLPGGMPLPPNWEELPEHQKVALRESSAYWQTAMNGVAEKHKGEMQAEKSDADMFRQLCADGNLLKQFAEQRIGAVQTNAPNAVPATAPAAPDIPDNLYEMNKEQLVGLVQSAVVNAQTVPSKELEDIKKQLQDQAVKTEFASLKAKFSDAEQYVAGMSPYWKAGLPLEDAYILAKAKAPASTAGLPAVAVSATPPPDQTSVALGSTTVIEESDAEGLEKLSSYQVAVLAASKDPELAKAMATLDGK